MKFNKSVYILVVIFFIGIIALVRYMNNMHEILIETASIRNAELYAQESWSPGLFVALDQGLLSSLPVHHRSC